MANIDIILHILTLSTHYLKKNAYTCVSFVDFKFWKKIWEIKDCS